MVAFGHTTRLRSDREGGFPLRLGCLALALVAVVGLPGCGGCTNDPGKAREELEKKAAEARAKKKKKPKPPFETTKLRTRPRGRRLATEAGEEMAALGPPCKPGHWTSGTLAAKTNHHDFLGDLEMVVLASDRGKLRPVHLPGTRFDLPTFRQVALPKRQPKVFESLLYVPVPEQREGITQLHVSCRLNARRGGRREHEVTHPLRGMRSYQYFFVVVARWPERYSHLHGLASINPPSDVTAGYVASQPYYRLALIEGDRRVGLPSHAACWTSIAYVLWDDAEPTALNSFQQRALLDWLHWGGQLIVSGPETLDTLRDSFLAPYLPATPVGIREVTAEDLAALTAWSDNGKTAASASALKPLEPADRWTGVELQPVARARFVPGSGRLLAERRVGRGRVVVSAFRLGGRELATWSGWDEVFNAMLLGRPARVFSAVSDPEADLQVEWADGHHRLDAARICDLRYFTRDTGVPWREYALDVVASGGETVRLPPAPGVAAWNDFNPVANAARAALLEAARIEIPEAAFVVWMVTGYLLVLVPLNWVVFRLLGRVEWAWVAAPVIAVVGTAVVIRLAQLDIGFARSRTEIAVVELQGEYPYAHVTRYNALYTSLATSYEFHFEDPGAVVQPFPNVNSPSEFHLQGRRSLGYRYGKEVSLLGYPVESNSTGLMHSEEMVDLQGAVCLVRAGDALEVCNQTGYTLFEAKAVRKRASGELEVAGLGRLEPGAKAWLNFHRSPARKNPTADGRVSIRALREEAEKAESLLPGELRLLAEIRDEIPGMTIRPAAPQVQRAALVVAHLDYGSGQPPQPDHNTPQHPRRSADRNFYSRVDGARPASPDHGKRGTPPRKDPSGRRRPTDRLAS